MNHFLRGKFCTASWMSLKKSKALQFWKPQVELWTCFGYVCFIERRDERLIVEQHFIAISFAKQMWALILEYAAITKPIVLDVIDGVSWFSVGRRFFNHQHLQGNKITAGNTPKTSWIDLQYSCFWKIFMAPEFWKNQPGLEWCTFQWCDGFRRGMIEIGIPFNGRLSCGVWLNTNAYIYTYIYIYLFLYIYIYFFILIFIYSIFILGIYIYIRLWLYIPIWTYAQRGINSRQTSMSQRLLI